MSKKLKTVFIVEDSAIESSMLKDHLSRHNLEVKEYASGNACIRELVIGTTKEPDLVLLDYFLDSSFGTSKDGLETLTKLKEICPNADVIMFTSVGNEKIIELSKQKGALDYVVKGVDGFKELDEALNRHYAMN